MTTIGRHVEPAIQHHDRNDSGDNAITESFKPSFTH